MWFLRQTFQWWLGRWLSSQEHLLLVQRIQVEFPQHTVASTICDFSSKGSMVVHLLKMEEKHPIHVQCRHLAPSTTKKGAQGLVCVFGFCRQHIPHLDLLLWPISLLNQRAANFLWVLGQVKTLQQVPAAVQAAPTSWTI